jgi:hypothetical protein
MKQNWKKNVIVHSDLVRREGMKAQEQCRSFLFQNRFLLLGKGGISLKIYELNNVEAQ